MIVILAVILAGCFIIFATLGIVFRSNLVNLYNSHYLYIPLGDREQAKDDAVVARKIAVESIKIKYGKDSKALYDRGFVDYKNGDYYNIWWIGVETEDDEEINVHVYPESGYSTDDYQIKEFYGDIKRTFKTDVGTPTSSEIEVDQRYLNNTSRYGLESKFEPGEGDSLKDILDWYYSHDGADKDSTPGMLKISVYSNEMKYNMQEKFEKKIQNIFGAYPVVIDMYDCDKSLIDKPDKSKPIHVYYYEKKEFSDETVSGEYYPY